MGFFEKVFGRSPAGEGERITDTQDRRNDKSRYDELIGRGLKPSEALHMIAAEKSAHRAESSRRINENKPEYIRTGKPKPLKSGMAKKIIAVDRAGRSWASHIQESGFLAPPRNQGESIFDFNKVRGQSSMLKKTLGYEPMFKSTGHSRKKKQGKGRSQKSGSRKGGRQIVIHL